MDSTTATAYTATAEMEEAIKTALLKIATIAYPVENGRIYALVKTKLEEALLWASRIEEPLPEKKAE